MEWLLLGLVVALFGTILGVAWWMDRRMAAREPVRETKTDPAWEPIARELDGLTTDVAQLQKDVRELAELVDYLPKKWEDINLKARSFYDRATYAVRRTRKELAALELGDDALDDLDEDVRELHGERGEEDGVPDVQEGVGGADEEDPAAKSFIYKMIRAR